MSAPKPVKFTNVDTDYVETYTVAEFVDTVRSGGICQDDGDAAWGKTEFGNIWASDVSFGLDGGVVKRPEWATHVIWYSK